MIKVNKTEVKIEGKENIICGELGIIFNCLYENIGEERTKSMVKIALDTVFEENKKEDRIKHIIKKKELKTKLREDLPKEIADILCSLI